MENTSTGIKENIAGLLCYLLAWITGLIFLLIEKENKTVRFHAWQSIFVFLPLTILNMVLSIVPVISWIITVITFVFWVVLMYKAYKGEKYKVRWAGDWAEKQVNK